MVDKKSIVKQIGDKEMDRKDFLKYSGLALLSLIGFRGLINILFQPQSKIIVRENEKPRGFGSGRYGA